MSVTPTSFRIERRFSCTPAQAFSAFADPELKRQWFANVGDFADAHWEMDFRVGGHEINSGGSPGRGHHEFRSTFHDIVENERIVFAYDLLLDHQLASVSLTSIEFRPEGDGTLLVFSERGLFLDGLDDPAGREHGTGKLLDVLERFLADRMVR
jgi:uncharacterized protein YndB with AHSA1/START domain